MIWTLLMGLAWGSDIDCAHDGWRHATSMAAAVDAPESVRPILSDLAYTSKPDPTCPTVELPPACLATGTAKAQGVGLALRVRSQQARAAAEVDDVGTLLGRRKQSNGLPEQDAGKLQVRMKLEADLLEAEQVWLDASRSWNAARCADACAVSGDSADPPGCAPHRGSAKVLARLRTLHHDLGRAQLAFTERFSVDALTARMEAADAAGPSDKATLAWVVRLQAALGASHARPAQARTRLATVLAALDGSPRLSPSERRSVQAWVVYDGSWRRAMKRLDRDVDSIIDRIGALQAAESRAARDLASQRLNRAFEVLSSRGSGVPQGL